MQRVEFSDHEIRAVRCVTCGVWIFSDERAIPGLSGEGIQPCCVHVVVRGQDDGHINEGLLDEDLPRENDFEVVIHGHPSAPAVVISREPVAAVAAVSMDDQVNFDDIAKRLGVADGEPPWHPHRYVVEPGSTGAVAPQVTATAAKDLGDGRCAVPKCPCHHNEDGPDAIAVYYSLRGAPSRRVWGVTFCARNFLGAVKARWDDRQKRRWRGEFDADSLEELAKDLFYEVFEHEHYHHLADCATWRYCRAVGPEEPLFKHGSARPPDPPVHPHDPLEEALANAWSFRRVAERFAADHPLQVRMGRQTREWWTRQGPGYRDAGSYLDEAWFRHAELLLVRWRSARSSDFGPLGDAWRPSSTPALWSPADIPLQVCGVEADLALVQKLVGDLRAVARGEYRGGGPSVAREEEAEGFVVARDRFRIEWRPFETRDPTVNPAPRTDSCVAFGDEALFPTPSWKRSDFSAHLREDGGGRLVSMYARPGAEKWTLSWHRIGSTAFAAFASFGVSMVAKAPVVFHSEGLKGNILVAIARNRWDLAASLDGPSETLASHTFPLFATPAGDDVVVTFVDGTRITFGQRDTTLTMRSIATPNADLWVESPLSHELGTPPTYEF